MVGKHEDTINKLQDDLLRHIINFLPTKDALKTSVFSKRWQHLWSSVSSIDLGDSFSIYDKLPLPPDYPGCRSFFLDFVDRLLILRDDSDMTKFRVSCDVPVSVVRLHSWISDVVKRNVRELDLSFPLTEICVLPFCLFTCQSLTSLRIDFECFLQFPSSFSIYFPNLRSLKLSEITFLSNHSVQQLFANSPVLKYLSLIECRWEYVNCLEISIPTLESIRINIIDGSVLLDCKVIIIAPRLSYFHCQTVATTIDVYLPYPPSLAYANLDFTMNRDEDNQVVVNHRVVRLLSSVRNSTSLILTSDALESLSSPENFPEYLPELQQLAHFEFDSPIRSDNIVEILKFMQKTPNLESLYLSQGLDNFDDEWIPEGFPECLFYKLKRFSFSFTDETDMHFIKKFMETCNSLEMVEVHTIERNSERLANIRKQLEALPCLSNKCVRVVKP